MKLLVGLLLVLGLGGCGASANSEVTGSESSRAPVQTTAAEPIVENAVEPAAPVNVIVPDATTVSKIVTPEQMSVGDIITNSIGMVLVPIPAGEFLMGSPATEPARRDNEDQHRVKISRPFYLGICEVTVAQFDKVMGMRPSHWKADNNPIEQVSWEQVTSFCRELSASAAEQQAGRVYRLPTEAEWEYACRAGSQTPFSFGSNPEEFGVYGWFLKNSDSRSHSVGQKKPNSFGLYDMHGNVWEWCQDWYGEFETGFSVDPTGPVSSFSRVRRGGSWEHPPRQGRSSHRSYLPPDYRYCKLGFRVALTPVTAGDE